MAIKNGAEVIDRRYFFEICAIELGVAVIPFRIVFSQKKYALPLRAPFWLF